MKEPLGQKQPKAKKDPAYLRAVRSLPCVICDAYGERQNSPTTAHHWIMGRGSARKTPDRQAIPLCDGHHQGTFDTSKTAIHREPDAWREAYGTDRDWVEVTQDKIEQMEALNV
jgi:hypothetical protein